MIPRAPIDPRTLARAVRPGRVLGIGTALYREVLTDPRHASAVLRRGLREARALHSRERRFVADTLFDLIRYGPLLDAATGTLGDAATRRWLAWAVHLGADDVSEAWEGPALPWEAAKDLGQVLKAAADPDALRAGVGPPDAARLRASLGDALEAFVDASNQRAATVVRLPPGTDRDAVVGCLADLGVEATCTPLSPWGLRLPTRVRPEALHGLPAPWALMDEASQLVALATGVRPGERVLDTCAGAGGKTLAMGAMMAGRGTLVATDVRAAALDSLRRRARDAGLGVDVRQLPDDDLGTFDRVLVDAPCTGSGVWRRHPELRWRLADLDVLTTLQAEVLDRAAHHVAPGGRLVYATCSVLAEENDQRATSFSAAHPDFEPVQASPEAAAADGLWLRTAPHVHDTDGFFAAAWRRRG